MQSNVYCTINLPSYFNFDTVLSKASSKLEGKKLNDFLIDSKILRSVYSSYTLSFNKDGAYQWRKLSLIHPLVYVQLVNHITKEEHWNAIKDRFELFQSNPKIVCCSMPLVNAETLTKDTILNWWERFEQEIISLASEYNVMGVTDISNCYSSIYTHTISWALHGKDIAKSNINNKSLLGNIIDSNIGFMQCYQTNGIPEGSVISDFIAELILGYADYLITQKIENSIDYKILRYRDDYRVFSNDKTQVEKIFKVITEVLSDLNLKLNSKKTFISDNILEDAIKKDRLYLLHHPIKHRSFQKRLYSIWLLGNKFPGCGSVQKELSLFYSSFEKISKIPNNIDQLVSLAINIMMISSKYYPICIAIISKCASLTGEYESYIAKIKKKFSDVPNTDYLDLWLQRLTLKTEHKDEFSCGLCKKVVDLNKLVWDWDWLNNMPFKEDIINQEIINEMTTVINSKEVSIFDNY